MVQKKKIKKDQEMNKSGGGETIAVYMADSLSVRFVLIYESVKAGIKLYSSCAC